MTDTAVPDAIWSHPARVRGTLALVPGRGERAAVYERFGKRLSADGYTVAIFESGVADATDWLSGADAPRVLVGSDSGAGAVLDALSRGAALEGAIVAGVLTGASVAEIPADEERTACPLHLGVLAENASVPDAPADSVTEAVPEAATLAAVDVPVLAFHGGADSVTNFADAAAALASIPDLELVETVDGLHDALNDASHRSVAASIVLWLERLRTGEVHAPVVRHAAEVLAP